MAEDNKVEQDKAKADAAEAAKRADEKVDETLKKIDAACNMLDSLKGRMDAWDKEDKERKDAFEKEEKERKDAEEKAKMPEAERLAADAKRRKDAEDDEKKKEEDDKKKADARADSLEQALVASNKRLEELTALIRQPVPEMHREELTTAQARADAVFVQLGDRAAIPLVGEAPMNYRRRMAKSLQTNSARWKETKLDGLDDATFATVEGDIYADALAAAKNPTNLPKGTIREIVKRTDEGHTIRTFVGADHFVKRFTPPARVSSTRDFNTPSKDARTGRN